MSAVPLCSEGRLLKKVIMKTCSLAPSSGQSPTLCPIDLHEDRTPVNEEQVQNKHQIMSEEMEVGHSPLEERRLRQNLHKRADDELRSKVAEEET